MGELFEFGWFDAHSGFQLPWKIDCDAWTDESLRGVAKMLKWKFAFDEVFAVPSLEGLGRNPAGPRLARILREEHAPDHGYPPLIVDDVLTTGRSIEEMRASVMRNRPLAQPIGFVLYSRAPQDGAALARPTWVHSLFDVNQLMQSRATGLG